jgi:hypothetical protein
MSENATRAEPPRIFRTMFAEENGLPRVGAAFGCLGVRVPPTSPPDVKPDASGNVAPRGGGMSVAPSWREIHPAVIPARLRDARTRDARGNDNLRVFRTGTGGFRDEPVSERLALRCTSPTHGQVEPYETMTASAFQAALADTQARWTIDET